MTAAAPALRTRGLGLDYGQFTAVRDVDLDVKPRTLHALIGPNGAGKTSFFNIISGRYAASRGKIEVEGNDITARPARSRVKLGMARSFQITTLFMESNVRENLRLAALGTTAGRAFRFWSKWSAETADKDSIEGVLDELELKKLAEVPVSVLSHGQQRLVEIGMCLVANPRILLLDEPLAGLGLADIPRITELLTRLKSRYTILLVEHNMRVVMKVSDRITVMFQGQVLAEGSPAEIRNNAEVRRAYLGSEA
jgi:branched-chain amino acid transport system ATP-binding protein